MGDATAALVDPPLTQEQTRKVGDWIEHSGKQLAHIYITHGHGDHWFGTGDLLRHFPTAQAWASCSRPGPRGGRGRRLLQRPPLPLGGRQRWLRRLATGTGHRRRAAPGRGGRGPPGPQPTRHPGHHRADPRLPQRRREPPRPASDSDGLLPGDARPPSGPTQPIAVVVRRADPARLNRGLVPGRLIIAANCRPQSSQPIQFDRHHALAFPVSRVGPASRPTASPVAVTSSVVAFSPRG
ncbi:MBL fold metallo-hydrolase [Streptomyces chartreusis]|uniref:MBL fold metallo-hydrolase n=1 Tax=Streptomyces chartreusis TaxID=1969 RepID=UPI0035D79661